MFKRSNFLIALATLSITTFSQEVQTEEVQEADRFQISYKLWTESNTNIKTEQRNHDNTEFNHELLINDSNTELFYRLRYRTKDASENDSVYDKYEVRIGKYNALQIFGGDIHPFIDFKIQNNKKNDMFGFEGMKSIGTGLTYVNGNYIQYHELLFLNYEGSSGISDSDGIYSENEIMYTMNIGDNGLYFRPGLYVEINDWDHYKFRNVETRFALGKTFGKWTPEIFTQIDILREEKVPGSDYSDIEQVEVGARLTYNATDALTLNTEIHQQLARDDYKDQTIDAGSKQQVYLEFGVQYSF